MNFEHMNIGWMQMTFQSSGRQIFYFLLIGCAAVFADFSVYSLTLNSFGPIFSKVFGFYTGVIISFILNGSLTFRNKKKSFLSSAYFFKYLLVLTISMLINVATNYLFLYFMPKIVDVTLLAFCAATFLSMCFNFLCIKFWVFR